MAGLLLAMALVPAGRADPRLVAEQAPAAIAVVVSTTNDVKDVSMEELREILALDRQFWPDRKRIVLLHRPSQSTELKVLLREVYRMDERTLLKAWVGKLHNGQIPAIPSVVRTSAAVGKAVRGLEGAISTVLASEVPENVRVLTIGGRKPGDADYPLVDRG